MIGVVILNFNSFEDTIILVKALQKQSLADDLKIVIVDNCSPNDSFSKLKYLGELYFNTIVNTRKPHTDTTLARMDVPKFVYA